MKKIALYNRDGYHMNLVQIEGNKYSLDFGDFPDWGRIQVTGSEGDYVAIDPTPGGPMLHVGKVLDGKKIKKITSEMNIGYVFEMED